MQLACILFLFLTLKDLFLPLYIATLIILAVILFVKHIKNKQAQKINNLQENLEKINSYNKDLLRKYVDAEEKLATQRKEIKELTTSKINFTNYLQEERKKHSVTKDEKIELKNQLNILKQSLEELKTTKYNIVTCPNCSNNLRVPNDKIGTFKCKKCEITLKSYNGILEDNIPTIQELKNQLEKKDAHLKIILDSNDKLRKSVQTKHEVNKKSVIDSMDSLFVEFLNTVNGNLIALSSILQDKAKRVILFKGFTAFLAKKHKTLDSELFSKLFVLKNNKIQAKNGKPLIPPEAAQIYKIWQLKSKIFNIPSDVIEDLDEKLYSDSLDSLFVSFLNDLGATLLDVAKKGYTLELHKEFLIYLYNEKIDTVDSPMWEKLFSIEDGEVLEDKDGNFIIPDTLLPLIQTWHKKSNIFNISTEAIEDLDEIENKEGIQDKRNVFDRKLRSLFAEADADVRNFFRTFHGEDVNELGIPKLLNSMDTFITFFQEIYPAKGTNKIWINLDKTKIDKQFKTKLGNPKNASGAKLVLWEKIEQTLSKLQLKQGVGDKDEKLHLKKIKDGNKILHEIKPEKSPSKNLYVKYQSTLKETNGHYPLIILPQRGCIIRSYRIGASKRRGYKDAPFQKSLEQYFSNLFLIHGNVRINTSNHSLPYEPDIALIDIKSGKNIRIDIEIDEPYSGINRTAIHYRGQDVQRDTYFKNRGWIVVRFSEYQVHTREKACLKFIGELIQCLGINYNIPNELNNIPNLLPEKQWDRLQSQKWEREKYRENYLNHVFKLESPSPRPVIDTKLSNEEKQEEREVPNRLKIKSETQLEYNDINKHQRDKLILFDAVPHLYYVKDVEFRSVTTVISDFFPEFDACEKAANLSPSNPLYGYSVSDIVRIWREKGENAANVGTYLHLQIENYLLGQSHDSKPHEFTYFLEFWKNNDLAPFRSEWRVFDVKHQIAGTIDLVVKTADGYDIYDWKRSKKIVDNYGKAVVDNSWGNRGIGKLGHIPDTSFNRYSLQQNIYKFILENNYGLTVNNMYLIILHPIHETYYKIKVEDMKKETYKILHSLSNIKSKNKSNSLRIVNNYDDINIIPYKKESSWYLYDIKHKKILSKEIDCYTKSDLAKVNHDGKNTLSIESTLWEIRKDGLYFNNHRKFDFSKNENISIKMGVHLGEFYTGFALLSFPAYTSYDGDIDLFEIGYIDIKGNCYWD